MPTTDPRGQLAAALGKIPSGIFVLTALNEDKSTGMLTSWVQQCSFEPPQVSVAVKRGRYIADWLNEGTLFTINVLDESQTDMIGHFGRGFGIDENAFEDIEAELRTEKPPILRESLCYLDCEVVTRVPGGDHDLFIARVVNGVLLNEGRPMVHIRKSGLHY